MERRSFTLQFNLVNATLEAYPSLLYEVTAELAPSTATTTPTTFVHQYDSRNRFAHQFVDRILAMTNARTAYRENDVRGASPVRLVVLLYDQIIQDLTQAAQAMEQDEIELRTQRIDHAILLIGHLQSPLDFVKGGKVAKDLDNFYNVLRQNLVQVQFHPSKSGIDRSDHGRAGGARSMDRSGAR